MKRAAFLLMTIAVALAAAQVPATSPDTVSRAEVVLAARQALEAASRNLGRWLTIVIIVVLIAAAIAISRIWSLARQLARLENLHAAWETRFAETTDEVLRLKRKLAEAQGKSERLEADIATLRPVGPDAATAQVAMVQSDLVAVRERLERAEEKLEAVADHTVVTKRDRATVEELVKTAARTAELATAAESQLAVVRERLDRAEERLDAVKDQAVVTKRERTAIEELMKTAGQARIAAEAAATRADGIARRAAVEELLRSGAQKLAQQQYPAAVQDCTRCLELLADSGTDSPQMRFRALHTRAAANLRQRELDAVLADADELEKLDTEPAQGAARLLAGVARLWQGAVAEALQDFTAAVEKDPGARAVLVQDEDIAAWVKANPKKAAPVKRFVSAVDKKPRTPRPPVAKKPARRR